MLAFHLKTVSFINHCSRHVIAVAFLFSAALDITMSSQASAQLQSLAHSRGELLVAPAEGVSRAELKVLYEGHGAKLKRVIDRLDVHHISVPEQAIDAVERALSRNPKIKYVERNALGKSTSTPVVPNDPEYYRQWHLPLIGSPAAWGYTTGSSSVPIAVLDAGFSTANMEIAPKFVKGYNAVTGGSDFAGNSSSSCWGHGTPVANIAAGIGNNASQTAGVAWGNPIMPVLVFDSACSLSVAYAAAGVIWAADNGARVINMSFIIYWSPPPKTFIDAVNYALKKGVVVVTAAGNDNRDAVNYAYPAYPQTIPGVITVSATDRYDQRTSWSNFGSNIAVAAPGDGVITTCASLNLCSTGGTSMSSPIVAGVAALIVSLNPQLSNMQVNDIIKNSADDLGAIGRDDYYGHGRVNAGKAIMLALNTTPEPPDTMAPSVSVTSPSSGSVVKGTISVSASASDNVGISKVELLVNGQLFATDSASPYSFSVDTTRYADGSLSLQARAYDNAGNVATSSSITVMVDNVVDVITKLSIILLTPNQVKAGQSVDVTISGDGILAGASVALSGNGGPAPSARVQSIAADGKSLVVRISTKAGKQSSTPKYWDVSVTNTNGQKATLPKSFLVYP